MRARTLVAGFLAVWIATAPCAQELSKELNETVVMIPKPGMLFTAQLETTIFKPEGEGPFPLAVYNHIWQPDAPHMKRARPLREARFFVSRGYVLAVPMRQGFSKSTGVHIRVGCNIKDNGLAQAEDVQATLDYMSAQPYADKNNIVIAGHYYGGWTTLAAGTLNYPGVKALVNFSGGMKQPGCAAWEANLMRAAASYGGATRTPSLWFYGENENDPLYSLELLRSMHAAYSAAGGRATLIELEKTGPKDTYLFSTKANLRTWPMEVEKFLKLTGLPHRVVWPHSAATPPPTDFTALENADALPYVDASGRKGYLAFLGRQYPRAFAIGPGGAWAAESGGEDPPRRALDRCSKLKQATGPCRLYTVNGDVVWKD